MARTVPALTDSATLTDIDCGSCYCTDRPGKASPERDAKSQLHGIVVGLMPPPTHLANISCGQLLRLTSGISGIIPSWAQCTTDTHASNHTNLATPKYQAVNVYNAHNSCNIAALLRAKGFLLGTELRFDADGFLVAASDRAALSI